MEKLKAFLQTVRPCGAGPSRLRFAGWCALLLCAGLAAGVGIKLLDIFTQNPGNLFSQLSVWIFLCTLIAAGSRSPLRAGAYVFQFAAGMLAFAATATAQTETKNAKNRPSLQTN